MEIDEDLVVLRLVAMDEFDRATRYFVRRYPRLAEDFIQEATLAVVEKLERILGAANLQAFLIRIVRHTCIDLIRREFRRPVRDRRRVSRRPRPIRRNLQEILQDLNGREAGPDFIAQVREELESNPPEPEPRPVSSAPYNGRNLTEGQRAILRKLLVAHPRWTRRQIADEFALRTGRTICRDKITDHRRALGLNSGNYHRGVRPDPWEIR
jgi:RNA polymerase sigma factor (sigma-70 family)